MDWHVDLNAPPSRPLAWLILTLVGLFVLLGPLIFAEQIARIANAAVVEARETPVLVAGLIITALTLDLFLPVPNGVTNSLAGSIFGFGIGICVIWISLTLASRCCRRSFPDLNTSPP